MTLLEKIKNDYEEHLKKHWTPDGERIEGYSIIEADGGKE